MRRKRVVAILTVIMVVTSCVSESMPIYAEDFISEESETPEFFEDQDSFGIHLAVLCRGYHGASTFRLWLRPLPLGMPEREKGRFPLDP